MKWSKFMGVGLIKTAVPAVTDLFQSTGHDELTLSALGAGDLPAVEPLIRICRTAFGHLFRTLHEFPAFHRLLLLINIQMVDMV
jgi:hypothetical protein